MTYQRVVKIEKTRSTNVDEDLMLSKASYRLNNMDKTCLSIEQDGT